MARIHAEIHGGPTGLKVWKGEDQFLPFTQKERQVLISEGGVPFSEYSKAFWFPGPERGNRQFREKIMSLLA